jgi:hypothetical protein
VRWLADQNTFTISHAARELGATKCKQMSTLSPSTFHILLIRPGFFSLIGPLSKLGGEGLRKGGRKCSDPSFISAKEN